MKNTFRALNRLGLGMSLLFFLLPIGCIGQYSTLSFPLKNLRVTSPFGPRVHPLTGKIGFHYGVDLYANSDSVYSVLDGKVSDSGSSTTLGNYIRVRHREIEITYSHLSQVFIHSGDSVQGGKVLGITGATGKVTGEHLHFSIRFRDKFIPPLKFLKSLFDLTNPPLNME